jgi:hypothetical protein
MHFQPKGFFVADLCPMGASLQKPLLKLLLASRIGVLSADHGSEYQAIRTKQQKPRASGAAWLEANDRSHHFGRAGGLISGSADAMCDMRGVVIWPLLE